MSGTDDLTLTPDELTRLLCPNPSSCGNPPRPPDEVVNLFGQSGACDFRPDIPPGSAFTLGDCPDQHRVTALVSRCRGCERLAVRSLSVSHGSLRVIFDTTGMTDLPGVSVNRNGRHPNMFADAMVYANQELGVRGGDNFLLCGDSESLTLERLNTTYEIRRN